MNETINKCKFNDDAKGKILVIGGTRGIGLEFILNSVGSGYSVRLLARNPDKFNFQHEKLEVVKGDFLDYDSLLSALEGIKDVVVSVGTKPTFKRVNLFSKGTENLIKAMKALGINNLFCVTGVGAGDTKGLGGVLYNKIILKTILKSMYSDKDVQENMIKNSGLNWLLIRPGYLTNGKNSGKYKIIKYYDSKTKVSMISRADVADFILKAIIKKNYFGSSVIITT